jgi:chemotaxis protein histidine kinase CheA
MRLLRAQFGIRIVCFLGAVALLLTGAGMGIRKAQAADPKTTLDKIKAHYQTAAAAYDDGDFDKTKRELLDVVALSKEGGLGTNKVVAQSYLLLGVLEVAGLKDTDTGVRYFAKALDISPAIQVPPSMATKAVLAAFERAESLPPPPRDPPATNPANTQETSPPAATEAEKEKPAPGPKEKKRVDAEGRGRETPDRDRDKLVDELAQAKIGESQAEADRAKQQKETQDRDKQLAEMKGRVSQLEKEKQEQDKQLTDVKTRLQQLDQQLNQQINKEKPEKDRQLVEVKGRASQLEREKQEQDKQLAAAKDAARKQSEASDQLKRDKLESDRQLADARARLQQITKDKQDTDQQLASARDADRREHEANARLDKAKVERAETDRQLFAAQQGEQREREAREKLEKVWQEAQARDKERKARDDQARLERDKLADGPDLPSHFAEPIYCTVPDEIPAGADLYVHCVPHPNVAAKVVALYYRAGGTVLYNATTMERSKKGWYTALIPGSRVTGKLLHYYVEARDARQNVAATNGKATSPNIAMVRDQPRRPQPIGTP